MTFEDEYVKSYKAYLESLEELERKENEILKKAIDKGRYDIVNEIEAEKILRESLHY